MRIFQGGGGGGEGEKTGKNNLKAKFKKIRSTTILLYTTMPTVHTFTVFLLICIVCAFCVCEVLALKQLSKNQKGRPEKGRWLSVWPCSLFHGTFHMKDGGGGREK